MTETEKRLSRIFIECLGTPPEERAAERGIDLADVRPVEHMGADSLDMVEIAMTCEDEFGIELHDEETAPHVDGEGSTFGELVKLIDSKLAVGAK